MYSSVCQAKSHEEEIKQRIIYCYLMKAYLLKITTGAKLTNMKV